MSFQGFIDDIGLALLEPRTMIATARAEGRGLGLPLLFVVLFSLGAAGGLTTPLLKVIASAVPASRLSLGLWSYAAIFLLVLAFGFILWLVDSLLIHALSLALGGHGGLEDVMAAVGYSYAAWWPLALSGAISLALHWLVGFAAVVIGFIASVVWRIYCLSLSVSEAEGYDAARGLVVVIVCKALEYIVIPLIIVWFSTIASLWVTPLPYWG